jgi:hypothetical protein
MIGPCITVFYRTNVIEEFAANGGNGLPIFKRSPRVFVFFGGYGYCEFHVAVLANA